MSISQVIAPHLPYLRRFARALTGSQASGDAYAIASLEAVLNDPSHFDAALEPRLALFKVFLAVWSSISLNSDGHNETLDQQLSDGKTIAGGQGNLAALTPLSRVAFLLSAVEGFNPEDIGVALSTTTTQARQLIDEAGLELARQIAVDVLIIEDEPIIALDLESLVQSLGHRVTGIARTHREAVAAAERQPPGLILADIQLADGSSGIEAVNEILRSFQAPVLFITAYPEKLLTGERPEPAFLIAKPFNPNMVKAVMSQALFFDQKSSRGG